MTQSARPHSSCCVSRADHRVRQSRLNRAAVPGRLPRRLPLRARPAGGGRGRDGGRLRPSHRAAGARQPAHRARSRQRDGRDLQRAGRTRRRSWSRRPAGARDDDARGPAHEPRPTRCPNRSSSGATSRRAPRTCRRRWHAAYHLAALRPTGRSSSPIPMDDWAADADEDVGAPDCAGDRPPRAPLGVGPALGRRLAGASSPVLVMGPDVDASGGWDAAVALAESGAGCPCGRRPPRGRAGSGFPEDHPSFQGSCRRRSPRWPETLRGTTWWS